MTITTTTHLNFRGDARAALELYQSVFGGETTLVTYQDAHAAQDPAEAEQIMWGQVQADNGFHVMAYDVPGRLPYEPGVNPVFVSVRGTDADEITAYWTGLSDGRDHRAGPRPRRLVAAVRHAPGPVRRGLGARRRRGVQPVLSPTGGPPTGVGEAPACTAPELSAPEGHRARRAGCESAPEPVGRTGHDDEERGGVMTAPDTITRPRPGVGPWPRLSVSAS